MTGLGKKKVEKASFQNTKMSEKIYKIGKKLLITGRNMVKDIHELVIELKQTVIELEDIAENVQEKAPIESNDTARVENKNATDLGNDSVDKRNHLLECDSCSKRFKKISDLEEHIKMKHEEYKTYKCEVCSKTFVTNWRLKKHAKMHLKDNLKKCYYYKNNRYCPFEELGCKFQHEPFIQVLNLQSKNDSDKSYSESTHSFYTSTPKKPDIMKCEDGHDTIDTQCAECFVINYIQHVQKRHKTRIHGENWTFEESE